MTDEIATTELVAQAAERAGLPVSVLSDLLALESDFPDFNVWGKKSEFTRRVAEILDTAAQARAAP